MSDVILRSKASSTEIGPAASRERAVSRTFKGTIMIYTGTATMVLTPFTIAAIFGASHATTRVAFFGGVLLVSTGLIAMAVSAMPHLRRFGGRLGTLAYASFGAAGISMLLALAGDVFEWSVLGSHVPGGLDSWGAWGAGVFAILGGLFLHLAHRKRGDHAETAKV